MTQNDLFNSLKEVAEEELEKLDIDKEIETKYKWHEEFKCECGIDVVRQKYGERPQYCSYCINNR